MSSNSSAESWDPFASLFEEDATYRPLTTAVLPQTTESVKSEPAKPDLAELEAQPIANAKANENAPKDKK